MSAYDGYDDEPRSYRSVRTRPRERGEPDYVREETYIERGKGPGPRGTELVYRGRDDSVEDIPRDFPPPGRRSTQRLGDYDDYASTRRARSSIAGRSRYEDDDYSYYEDDRYTDNTAATSVRRRDRDRRRRQDRDYDSEYSQSPPPRERRKSGVGELLGGLGLGGVVGALSGKKDRDRSDSRGARSTRSRSRAQSRRYSSDEDTRRSRSRHGDRGKTERKWAQAAQAALVAGAIEAYRSRKEPGPWTGERGKRIATAALGAGGIDGLIDRDPDKKTKRHLAEAVVGGIVANRLANGPRSKSRGRGDASRDISPDSRAPRSRSRSIIDRFRGRSQSRGRALSDDGRGDGRDSSRGGALKGLAAGGALAAAGKAIYDRVRSKSRKRRSPSNSSADSYVPSRNRRRDNRRSQPTDAGNTRRTGGATDRGINDDNDSNRGNGTVARAGAAGAGAGALIKSHDHDNNGNNSDSSSTTDMENKRKKMRGKEMITMGLATVATIHAAHGVYSSMEAHEKRHRLVAEGEMTPEEARKKQTKAWIQDAAAVGIAALGIKGAFSEWKEMNEQRREIHEIEKRKRERRKKLNRQKKQEERDRHERMMKIFEQNPQLAMGFQMNQGGTPELQMPTPGGGGRPLPDQSGNPYAQGR